MKYIPSPEYYKEFFRRVPGESGLIYRSISNTNIPSKTPSHEENKNTPQVIKPNLLDLNLSLLEATLNPDYEINQINYLLEMKANPNLSLASGDKLAKKAIIQGQTDIITLLLKHGLDLDTPITGRASQQNAVQLARQWKRTEILELFERHIAMQKENHSLLHHGGPDSAPNLFAGQALDLHSVIPVEEDSLDSH